MGIRRRTRSGRAALAAGFGVALAGCAEVPAEPGEGARMGVRSQPIQRGVAYKPADAAAAGIVALRATNDPTKLTGGENCTATVIGPRILLTAEHCVRAFDEGKKTWGNL